MTDGADPLYSFQEWRRGLRAFCNEEATVPLRARVTSSSLISDVPIMTACRRACATINGDLLVHLSIRNSTNIEVNLY